MTQYSASTERKLFMYIQAILVIAFSLFVSSCSTSPVSQVNAPRVPSDRVFMPSYLGQAEGPNDATILFLRDSGFFASGCGFNMYIDFQKVFEIRNGEQITIHVPAGRHIFEYESGRLCPDKTVRQETTINAGNREVYRIYPYGFTRIE